MFASRAWQQPNTHHAEPRSARVDLRDRVKLYAPQKASTANSASSNGPSPSQTDAFFSRPTPFADQVNARKVTAVDRQQRRRQHGGAQCDTPQEPQEPQRHRPSLTELQASASPVAKELIDNVVSSGDRIYSEALVNLSTTHKELTKIITEATAEDDRVVSLLTTNTKKIIKAPAETRITDEETGEEMQVGQRVAAGKARIDTLEADVVSLWELWEAAQAEVDMRTAELEDTHSSTRDSVIGVQDSLAREMEKFEAELASILENVHEDARTAEKDFSNKIKGVMSALLQQYFLED
ncbi:unnamed protein product [Discula destructiva]